jgi:selenocysteine lyase/cysteine desulfurase
MDEATMQTLRSMFPVTERYIYLDHAGVAPLSTRVRDAVAETAASCAEHGAFGYPGWVERIEAVRAGCAGLINARKNEIAFVRSTSHGLSLVARGLDWREGDNVVYCEKDFPSNLFPWERLRQRGVEVRAVPAREGRIGVREIEARIDHRTRLVAVSSVQFVSGYRIDLAQLGTLCRSRNVLLCVDAIQSLGLLPMDVQAFGIDLLAADAHKWLLGPEGIGIFYCRTGLAERLEPALVGWKSVENAFSFERPELKLRNDALRFEEGTPNLLGILGMGAAVDLLLEIGVGKIGERVQDLGERIIAGAEQRSFSVLTPKDRRERGGAVTFGGPFDPEQTRTALRERGILVNVRGGGLRVSPHVYNTEEEIARFFATIDELC